MTYENPYAYLGYSGAFPATTKPYVPPKPAKMVWTVSKCWICDEKSGPVKVEEKYVGSENTNFECTACEVRWRGGGFIDESVEAEGDGLGNPSRKLP